MRLPAIGRLLVITWTAWMLLAAGASAADSAATTLTNPLASGADELGHATLTANYTGGPDTVDVSASAEVQLQPGMQFKATVCLNVHVLNSAPDGSCVISGIDTRAETATRTYAIAPLSRTVDRPAAGNTGYATQHVIVTHTGWTLLANSWPATNLAGASVPLFAADATSGPLPAQQGVELDSTPVHGGANTALPDSMCVSNPWPPATPRPDLDTDALGPMAFHYEVGEPSGAHAGRAPAGVLLLFHGGGWTSNGGGAAQSVRGEADRWRARGWRTVNASYRPCGESVDDAVSLYDRVRSAYGSASAVCTLGQSAGGHLALMVAARRPGGVRCVIDQAGPTDAPSLAVQAAFDPAGSGTQTNGPRAVLNMMVAAFGQENLASVSPAQMIVGGLEGTRVLAATGANDNLIPYGQMTRLRDAMRAADPGAYVETMQLAGGDTPFVHGYISQAAQAAYQRAEEDLVAPFAPPAPADPDPIPTPAPPVADVAPVAGSAPPARAAVGAPVSTAPLWAPMAQRAPDIAAPRARLTARRVQRVGSRLKIEVSCIDEACRTVARATVAVPKLGARRARTYTASPARTSIAAGARARIVIRLPRAMAAAAARASKAGRSTSARVTVVVTDAAGNRRKLTRQIVLTS